MSTVDLPVPHLRIARPVADPSRSAAMYCDGLGLQLLARFDDHAGFDGAIVGAPGATYHFEFTRCRAHPVAPVPTAEDLTVFYIPDADGWRASCARAEAAGFIRVESLNPYWERAGRTFVDMDGYRVVLQNASWGDKAQ